MLRSSKISTGDINLLRVSDDPQEICKIVCEAHKENYRLEGEHLQSYQHKSIR